MSTPAYTAKLASELYEANAKLKKVQADFADDVGEMRGDIRSSSNALLQWMNANGVDLFRIPGTTSKYLKRHVSVNRVAMTPDHFMQAWSDVYNDACVEPLTGPAPPSSEEFADLISMLLMNKLKQLTARVTESVEVVERDSAAFRRRSNVGGDPPRENVLVQMNSSTVDILRVLMRAQGEYAKLKGDRHKESKPLKEQIGRVQGRIIEQQCGGEEAAETQDDHDDDDQALRRRVIGEVPVNGGDTLVRAEIKRSCRSTKASGVKTMAAIVQSVCNQVIRDGHAMDSYHHGLPEIDRAVLEMVAKQEIENKKKKNVTLGVLFKKVKKK